MAQSGMVWHGMKEYQDEIRKMPEDCRREAANLIEAGVNSAYATVKRVYEAHRFTGTLSNRLTISVKPCGFTLRSASPLAWLFDNGSQARHYVTERGKTHLTGRMPATHIFSRTVGFTRRKLSQQFREMLFRRGAASVTET